MFFPKSDRPSTAVTPSMCFFLFVFFLLVQMLSVMTLWSILGGDPAVDAHINAVLERQARWKAFAGDAARAVVADPSAASVSSDALTNDKLMALLPSLPPPLPTLTSEQLSSLVTYLVEKYKASNSEVKRLVKKIQQVCCAFVLVLVCYTGLFTLLTLQHSSRAFCIFFIFLGC